MTFNKPLRIKGHEIAPRYHLCIDTYKYFSEESFQFAFPLIFRLSTRKVFLYDFKRYDWSCKLSAEADDSDKKMNGE